jgi:hydrogenase maturation protein HypF
MRALEAEAPPLARIDSLETVDNRVNGHETFEIVLSKSMASAFQPISPDVSVCEDCQRELYEPADRRYRYPFINCTNCGPRFTIIEDIPYDRPKTTMASFRMCPDCEAEYRDPADRRFHAQPVACPACGPQVWLEEQKRPEATHSQSFDHQYDQLPDSRSRHLSGESAIQRTRQLLCEGKIVAVKGLGGFHLACDATNTAAVNELRKRKLRVDKPFAVMMWDVTTVARHCLVNEAEEELLTSRQRPIVILGRRGDTAIATEVAPGQQTVGVMLPYTPLHCLLLEPEPKFPEALVMTSGNICEEPIAVSNDEARSRLTVMADAFLFHDRGIGIRCDDSVMRASPTENQRAADSRPVPLRRSRGYAPFPVRLPWMMPPVLAAGGELKNVFCITRERYAFLSHHIGDMENYETLRSFESSVKHFERLFRIRPEAIGHDLHPDYLATRYAQERAAREGIPAFGVQHHYAHVVACLAEHNHDGERPVIGVVFDGTGYGDDGAIWGGEFLLANYDGYQRVAHLDYVPLPGGDKAIMEPWRMALSWLHKADIEDIDDLPPFTDKQTTKTHLHTIRRQVETGLNAPPTSSMGRLFDAVAALAGVRQAINYEAQAAIELEALVDPGERGWYPFDRAEGVVDGIPLIATVIGDLRAGESINKIAARFHNGVAQMVVDECCRLRQQFGISEVALSGGVWQNMTLLAKTVSLLRDQRFSVLIHHQVPANDGGLALGQAAVVARALA